MRAGCIPQTRPVWDCLSTDPSGTTPGRFSAVRTGSPRQVVSGSPTWKWMAWTRLEHDLRHETGWCSPVLHVTSRHHVMCPSEWAPHDSAHERIRDSTTRRLGTPKPALLTATLRKRRSDFERSSMKSGSPLGTHCIYPRSPVRLFY